MRRSRRQLGADIAGRARLVVDRDRLTPALLDLFADQARQDVRTGTG